MTKSGGGHREGRALLAVIGAVIAWVYIWDLNRSYSVDLDLDRVGGCKALGELAICVDGRIPCEGEFTFHKKGEVSVCARYGEEGTLLTKAEMTWEEFSGDTDARVDLDKNSPPAKWKGNDVQFLVFKVKEIKGNTPAKSEEVISKGEVGGKWDLKSTTPEEVVVYY